jgi:hypothetical protein
MGTTLRSAGVPLSQEILGYPPLQEPLTIEGIRGLTLTYLDAMRIKKGGEFGGFRHSGSTKKPVLYATLGALLVKHLYGVEDERNFEELRYILRFQSEDGLFRDPVINCRLADTEDWWGWRHLTLHALMTLALYNVPAEREIVYMNRFLDKDRFRNFINSRDWGARAAWTSNELQNLGVMLQYARDYQSSPTAGDLLEVLYEAIDDHQDSETGLFGQSFKGAEDLSLGVQAGYHFWLLYFYDKRPILHVDRIIDSLLPTQNILGGYGVKWNSSACEDIDSIDSLVRLSPLTNYRCDDIQASLGRALPAILNNLNGDGGWVFRRHESLTVGHPQMFSKENESNIFYTWFRTLGLAYCLSGLRNIPLRLEYNWKFGHVPGHQFL